MVAEVEELLKCVPRLTLCVYLKKKKLVYKCAGLQMPQHMCGGQIATLGTYQSSLSSLHEAGSLHAIVYIRPPKNSQAVLGLQACIAALGFAWALEIKTVVATHAQSASGLLPPLYTLKTLGP